MTHTYKQAAARAVLEHIPHDCRLGVGTGSTVNCLIELLPEVKNRLACVVASSEESARRLAHAGIECSPLDSVGDIDIYIDGADEVDENRQMLKGGGGAHTREKILAVAARRFIAIVSADKQVRRLGKFPLAVEVIPMARGYVARRLAGMGGKVSWREGFVTDNSNWVLDVSLLDLTAAADTENRINQIVGVVENGIFAVRRADMVLAAGDSGIVQHTADNDTR